MDVSVLLEPTIDLPRLAEVLDGLGHEGRVHTAHGWTPRQQAQLYEAAKGRPIDLDFLVPPSTGKLVEVIHEGKNTLPMFSHFQKRFVKLPEGEDEKVAGYNHQAWNAFTGPGYFVVRPGTGEHEGEILIDYTKLPKEKPASWPKIRENAGPIASIVYGNMIDYLRPLSSHVSIGRAAKHGKMMNQWFVMVRKDPG